MPQLEGQPGSRGMNPPGGISTINLSNWSDPAPSQRNTRASDDSFSQSGNENSGSRPSAGLSDTNSSRGLARMHHQAPGGNSTLSFDAQSPAAESETLLKKRSGYDEKRREMYGSGIFNETSGSCDGDGGYGGSADKTLSAGGTQQPRCRVQSDAKHRELFGSTPTDYQELRWRPTSDAKAKELNGNNIFGNSNHPPSCEPDGNRFPLRQPSNNTIGVTSPSSADHSQYNFDGGAKQSNETLNDLTGRLSFSDAKARELAGDNIFGSCPVDAAKIAAHNREPAGKKSQLMIDDNAEFYDKKRHEMKSAELSGNIFHGTSSQQQEAPLHHQRSVAKVREMSGSDIFSDDQPKVRHAVGGIRKPPGGGSTILLA